MRLRLCAFADEAGSSLKEQIEALKRNGISFIEIRNVDGQNIADITLEKAAEIKKELDKNNISVFSIGSPIGKIEADADFNAHIIKLKHILSLCKIFECDKIRMFSFFTTDYENHREEVIRRLNEMVSLAQKENVGLYHENEKDIYGDRVDRVIDILKNVKGLKSIYDPANYIQSGEDMDYAINTALQKADYLHIKDVIKGTGELVPAGYGDCQIKEMIILVNKDIVTTLEPHLALFGGYSNIDSHEMKTKFKFNSNTESFDAACAAFKEILKDIGFILDEGDFVR